MKKYIVLSVLALLFALNLRANEPVKIFKYSIISGINLSKYRNADLKYQTGFKLGGKMRYDFTSPDRGGEYQIRLPDGTKVWLNAESVLRFPGIFSGDERQVYAQGELYFEVARAAGLNFRFMIFSSGSSSTSKPPKTQL